MCNAAKKYLLYVNDFFMKQAHSFIKTGMKKALGIEHYWGRVEFALGRGAIHLHTVGIANDKAYLREFYLAKSFHKKAQVLDQYAKLHFDMTADANVSDNRDHHLDYLTSLLGTRYSKSANEEEDVQ
jgi:hypothetical protein